MIVIVVKSAIPSRKIAQMGFIARTYRTGRGRVRVAMCQWMLAPLLGKLVVTKFCVPRILCVYATIGLFIAPGRAKWAIAPKATSALPWPMGALFVLVVSGESVRKDLNLVSLARNEVSVTPVFFASMIPCTLIETPVS